MDLRNLGSCVVGSMIDGMIRDVIADVIGEAPATVCPCDCGSIRRHLDASLPSDLEERLTMVRHSSPRHPPDTPQTHPEFTRLSLESQQSPTSQSD